MKLFLIAVLISISCVLTLAERSTYNEKYDGMNIDEALKNRRLLTAYVKCILEEGKCTPEGKELKEHITEALKNGCAKCTEPQRRGVRKVIKHLINNEEEYWNRMVDKYDKKREYTKKYEKELKSIQG